MDFLLGNSVWVYLLIFIGKIIEVSLATLRIMLINRGERVKGSLIALLEVTIWIMITGSVLASFSEDKIKIVIYIAAFALGNYYGSWLESKLAFGISSINVIFKEGKMINVVLHRLRSAGYAVTVIDGHGKDGLRKLLIIHIKRKNIPMAVKIISETSQDCIIAVNDVKTIRGGYIKK